MGQASGEAGDKRRQAGVCAVSLRALNRKASCRRNVHTAGWDTCSFFLSRRGCKDGCVLSRAFARGEIGAYFVKKKILGKPFSHLSPRHFSQGGEIK